MNVREWMATPPITVPISATVAEIARLMLDRHLSGIPVVDADGKLVGLVHQRDVVAKHARVHLPTYFSILGTSIPFGTRHAEDDVRHVLAVTAGDLMNTDVATIDPEASIDDAATLMIDEHTDFLPVVEDDILVGGISHLDIIRILLSEEREAGDATLTGR